MCDFSEPGAADREETEFQESVRESETVKVLVKFEVKQEFEMEVELPRRFDVSGKFVGADELTDKDLDDLLEKAKETIDDGSHTISGLTA